MAPPIPRSVVAICLALGCRVAVGQTTIFQDDFNIDPGSNGWTESIVTTNTATGDIVPTGTAAEIDKTGGTGAVNGTITRFFDFSGFTNVTLELIAFQSATSFEGGAFGATNTDSLSIYIDSGSGFVPLFQRTGVWGAPGAGFSDGGSGPGTTAPTSSGVFSLASAAGNASFGIAIEGIVSAAAESYFLDQFTLLGDRVLVTVPGTPPPGVSIPPTTVIEFDADAFASFFESGLPAVAVLNDANLSAISTGRRDVNGRLFRMRAGVESKTSTSSRGDSDSAAEQIAISPQSSSWQWFAQGDFGSRRIEAVGSEIGKATDAQSSSVGVEFTPGAEWALGAAWTYLESDTDLARGLGSLDVDGQMAHFYTSWLPSESAYLSALYTYSNLQNELTRNTGLGTMTRGTPDSMAHSATLDGGLHFRHGEGEEPIVFGPYLGLDYTEGVIEEFRELGPIRGALAVAEQDYESLISRLGWQVSRTSRSGNLSVTPQIRAAWEREHEGPGDSVSASLQQSPFSVVQGGQVVGTVGGLGSTLRQANPERDYLAAGGGLQIGFAEKWSVSIDYEGRFFRESESSHFGGVRISGKF